jgi:hypothetical protein
MLHKKVPLRQIVHMIRQGNEFEDMAAKIL